MQILRETCERIEQTVEGTLQGLERRRMADKHKAKNITVSILGTLTIVYLVLIFCKGYNSKALEGIFALALFDVLMYFVFKDLFYTIFKKKHIKTYKAQVVPTLVESVFPGASYSPKGAISKRDLKETGLFKFKREHDFESEDTITGRIGKTDFSFCEIRVSHQEQNGEDSYKTVYDFFGFAFIADFNKHFHGRTLFSSKKSHLNVGFFSDLQPCVIEDLEFEKRFMTYATDDQQARYIITPGLQQRILDLNDFFDNQELGISFHDGLMFMIVDSGTNHFEVNYDFDGVKRDLFALSILGDIVEQMNLNLRIWSKE